MLNQLAARDRYDYSAVQALTSGNLTTSQFPPAGDSSPPRVDVLGIQITEIDLEGAVATLDAWRNGNHRDYVCCVSVHGLVVAHRDAEVRNALKGCGLATKDGMPLVWWCRRSGFTNSTRVCGPDLLDAVCAFGLTRGYRHYFYGGAPAVVEKLMYNLSARHPGLIIAGHRSPPFRPLTQEEDALDIAAINDAQPDFVWVGLGMPKQEKWMAARIGKIQATAMLGVGAAFDFHAGTKSRPPGWVQRAGFEWLFRLVSEPRRLARRYLVDNSIFIGLTIGHFTGLKIHTQDM